MPRLTSTIRDRIASDPMRKFKQSQVAPEWLSGAGIWVGVAIVVLVIGFMIFAGVTSDGPSEQTAATQNGQQQQQQGGDPQQEINPFETDSPNGASDGGASAAPTDDSDGAASGESGEEDHGDGSQFRTADFTDTNGEAMPVESSSLDSNAPTGAVNVAKAGALGLTSGDWSDIPTSKSPDEDRYLGMTVDWDSVRMSEPAPSDADENTSYTFLFDATDKDGAKSQFSVTTKLNGDTYQVVIF